MINRRLKNITTIIGGFTGRNGEPADEHEFYILKSMWIMMLSEFEGAVKDLVETHLDKMRTLEIEKIHICLLLQNFHPNSDEDLTMNKIIAVYKKDPKEIAYRNFTKDYKAKYKSGAIERLFNTIGIFLTQDQLNQLKLIDGIASTRDAIAHGDKEIQITNNEIKEHLKELKRIYKMLKVLIS